MILSKGKTGQRLGVKAGQEKPPRHSAPSITVDGDLAADDSPKPKRESNPRPGSMGPSAGLSASSSVISPRRNQSAPRSPTRSPATRSTSSIPKLPEFVPRASDHDLPERKWTDGSGDSLHVSPRGRSANPSRSPRGAIAGEGRAPDGGPALPAKHPNLGTMKKRRQVVAEIVQSEEVYVGALETLLKVYKEPLSRVVGEEELDNIFLNTEDLYKRHVALLRMMRAHALDDDLHPIGGLISSMVTGPAWHLYLRHIQDFARAGAALRALSGKGARVLAGLSHCPDTLMGAKALEMVRVAPVQRLPRYVLLLREVLKYTPPTHPDYKVARQVADKLETMLAETNEAHK